MNFTLGDTIDLANGVEISFVNRPREPALVVSAPVRCMCDACVAESYDACWDMFIMRADGEVSAFSFLDYQEYFVIR